MDYNELNPDMPEEGGVEAFDGLTDEEGILVYKIYNLIAGGITDPQIQALLIYRHLVHSGWLPPTVAENLSELKDNAIQDLKLLRKELTD